MIKEEIVFREAEIADKEDILELFRACYAQSKVTEKDPAYWEWQMIKNPDGKAFIGIAEINNVIVAHYAVIPLIYQTKEGQEINVGLVVDVMTHPQYQRRGLFVAIGRYTLPEAVKKLNLTFTIGYPFTGTTYNSVIPGHQKVGWKLCDQLVFYMLPIKAEKIFSYIFPSLSIFSKFVEIPSSILLSIWKRLKSRKLYKTIDISKKKEYRISIDKIPNFNQSDIDLYQKYSKGKFIKRRDMNFLNWRFCTKPNFNYNVIRIIGPKNETIAIEIIAIYYLERIKMGVIIDIMGDDTHIAELMYYSNIYLKKRGCEAIVLLDYKQSELSKIRKSLGFFNTIDYYQIINWKDKQTKFRFPRFPKINFLDFDIF